jgi:hypothetical protein
LEIQPERTTSCGIKTHNMPNMPFRTEPRSLAVDRRGDDDRKPDHDRTDHDAERGIMILFYLFVNVEDLAQYRVSDAKDHEPDENKEQRADEHLKQLIELYDEAKNTRTKKS